MVFSVAILSLLSDEGVTDSSRTHARDLVAGVAKLLHGAPGQPFSVVRQAMGPIRAVNEAITSCRTEGVDWIITIGGIGLHRRDYAPEAITPLIDRPNPGLVHEILQATPTPALSRPVAGGIGDSLITTFPGNLDAVKVIMSALLKDSTVLQVLDIMNGGSGDLVGLAAGPPDDPVSSSNPVPSELDRNASSCTFESVLTSSDPHVSNPSTVVPWTSYDITFDEPTGTQSDVEAPLTLEGHTLTATPSGDLYLFGGLGRTNAVYLLSAANLRGPSAHFILVPTTGDAPSARMNHRAVLYGSLLIIWGGQEVNSLAMSGIDLHILDLALYVWVTVKAFGRTPKPRFNHILTITDAVLHVAGGRDVSQALHDVWEFDLRKLPLSQGPPRWKICANNDSRNACTVSATYHTDAGYTCILGVESKGCAAWVADSENYGSGYVLSTRLTTRATEYPMDEQLVDPSQLNAIDVGSRLFVLGGGTLDVFDVSTREWLPRPTNSDFVPISGAKYSLASSGSNIYILGNISSGNSNSSPVLRVLDTRLAWTPTREMFDWDSPLSSMIPKSRFIV